MTTDRALKIDGKTVYVGEIANATERTTRIVLARSPREAVEILRNEISNSREYGVSVTRPKVIEKSKKHNWKLYSTYDRCVTCGIMRSSGKANRYYVKNGKNIGKHAPDCIPSKTNGAQI
jgi:hypothetical protein